MKKVALSLLFFALIITNGAFASEIIPGNTPTSSNLTQKACSNIFTLVNFDLSAFSPRISPTDVNIKDNVLNEGRRKEGPKEIFVNDKKDGCVVKDRTSLFRLDLLGIIKLRLF